MKAGVPPLLAAALLLGACTSNVYMGIPLSAGTGDPTLRSLAQRASSGDKQAQLDLGICFEEGARVDRDLRKAKKLYRKAASATGGTLWVYTPPVGKGGGRVLPVDRGMRVAGLAEAKRRLAALQ